MGVYPQIAEVGFTATFTIIFLCPASSSSNPGPKLWIFLGDKSVISLGKCDELLQFLILSAMKRMSAFECGSRFHNLPLELSK